MRNSRAIEYLVALFMVRFMARVIVSVIIRLQDKNVFMGSKSYVLTEIQDKNFAFSRRLVRATNFYINPCKIMVGRSHCQTIKSIEKCSKRRILKGR